MRVEMSSQSDDIAYQVGARELSDEFVDFGDDTETVRFRMEADAVFDQIANRMYESNSAALREGLTNAYATTITAEREFNIDRMLNPVEVTAVKDESEIQLSIEDFGEGITRDVLNEVLSYIGRGNKRVKGDVAGQHGIGFLAFYKLIEPTSAFYMFTNPRKSGEDAYSAAWNSKGCSIDHNGVLPKKKTGDNYGTRFELFIDSTAKNISLVDIGTWVDNLAKFSRVPVTYTTKNTTNGNTSTMSYEPQALTELYSDDIPYLSIETKYFSAYCTPESDSRTILLDVPVKRNAYANVLYGTIDIRFNNENGIIISGPNEGLTPVTQSEYSDLTDSEKERHILYSELHEDDISLPKPTGTRDTLNESADFWNHLVTTFNTQFRRYVSESFNSVTREHLCNISRSNLKQLNTIYRELYENRDSWRKMDISLVHRKVNRKYDVTIPTEIASIFRDLNTVVTQLDPGKTNPTQYDKKRVREPTRAIEISSSKQTYMGVSINPQRSTVVWEDSQDNHIVKLESADVYDLYEDILGWKKLTTVKKSTLNEFDISESTKNEFLSRFGNSEVVQNTQSSLVIRCDTTYRATVRDIESALQSAEDGHSRITITRHCTPATLVLFPDSTDTLISNHYSLATNDLAIARCSEADSNRLTQYTNCCTIDEFKNSSENIWVDSNHGLINANNSDKPVLIHIVSQQLKKRLENERLTNEIATILRKNHYSAQEDIYYVCISPKDTYTMIPLMANESVQFVSSNTNSLNTAVTATQSMPEAKLYALAVSKCTSLDSTIINLVCDMRHRTLRANTTAVIDLIDAKLEQIDEAYDSTNTHT